MRLAVDPERAAGDHRPGPFGQGRREFGGHVDAVAAGRPGPHDGYRAQAGEPEVHPGRVPTAPTACPRPACPARVGLSGSPGQTRRIPSRCHASTVVAVGASPSRAAHRCRARSRPGTASPVSRAAPVVSAATSAAGDLRCSTAPSCGSPGSAIQVSTARASRSPRCPSCGRLSCGRLSCGRLSCGRPSCGRPCCQSVTAAPPATGRARRSSGRRPGAAPRPGRPASRPP